ETTTSSSTSPPPSSSTAQSTAPMTPPSSSSSQPSPSTPSSSDTSSSSATPATPPSSSESKSSSSATSPSGAEPKKYEQKKDEQKKYLRTRRRQLSARGRASPPIGCAAMNVASNAMSKMRSWPAMGKVSSASARERRAPNGAPIDMHVLDTTMLYGPMGGGVARYLKEKRSWLAR